ncbi:TonB-dependent receptor [Halarcobacter mediterraneus]|uniref:TonB-dependent receptor n=1 Tax=Halarcobacter mediterraneus TaxID=2023153 RepID=A0A4V1M1D4_9BACT|nr:TonB-dependent receptor [Halarcobacter mediterraneus]RXK13274.1 TonB-dependent receptor [Halarcobacter mediterraneus]
MKLKPIKLSLAALLPYALYAQTPTQLEKVDVIEVLNDTNNIQIDLQRAQNNQVNSLFDLFKDNPSTDVGGGAINVQRIYLRGVESTSLNITLDGAKQGKNIFQHRGNELGVNPDILKQVQVKTYTDASDNSGALGGSIIMETKDAQDFVTGDKTFGGIIKTGYETNANTKLGSLIAYNVINPYFGVYANISGVNSDNYEDGNESELYATAYKDRDYFLKFSLLDYEDHTLKASFGKNENSGRFQWGRLGSDAGLHDPDGPYPLEKIVSTTTSYSAQHNYNPDNNLINLQTDLNLSTVNVDRQDNDLEYDNETLGIKGQNHFNFNFLNTTNRLSFGAQYEQQEGEGEFTPFASHEAITKYADVNSENKAIFIQNRMNINALNIYYGLRFDDYEFETGLGKATDTTLSPNLGFDYELNESSKFYANYGESSRMTGIIPFTWMNHIKKDTTYSDDLNAETSKKYEIGYKYNTNDLLTNNDYFTFDINLFKTQIEDLIIARDVDGGSGEGGRTLEDIYNSSNEFEIEGFEIKFLWNYENYTTNLSYSHINAETNNENATSTTGVNEAIAIRRVGAYDTRKVVWTNYYDINNNFNLAYTLSAVKGINNPVVRPGYITHDINIRYTPSNYSDWTFYAGVDNLTDKAYGKHTSIEAGTPPAYRYEPGRNFKFSVKYTF